MQADGGVSKKILKAGSGWGTPETGDQVFGGYFLCAPLSYSLHALIAFQDMYTMTRHAALHFVAKTSFHCTMLAHTPRRHR